MKQQKSLAGSSAKKRKILLGTLIPLAIAAVSLPIALSLSSCSCGNTSDDTVTIIFNNKNDFQTYCMDHTNNLLPAGTSMNFGGTAIDDPDMLQWFNSHMDNQTLILANLCLAANTQIVFPLSYTLLENGAHCKFILISSGILNNIDMYVFRSSIDYTYTFSQKINDAAPLIITSKITKIGTNDSSTRTVKVGIGEMSWSELIWTNITFPTTDPDSQ